MNETVTVATAEMLTVSSDLLGELRATTDDVIHFASGMLGFPECRRFVLVPGTREGMFWLQSLEFPTLAFLLIDPFQFIDGYTVDLAPADLAELGGGEPGDFAILTVVTLPRTRGELPTTNLQGPLALNLRERCAKQVICTERDHAVRCPVDLLRAVA